MMWLRLSRVQKRLSKLSRSRTTKGRASVRPFVRLRSQKACPQLHDIDQRFATENATNLISSDASSARAKLRRRSCDVWGDEQVGAFPKRMLRRQRLGIGDVEGGADASCIERLH